MASITNNIISQTYMSRLSYDTQVICFIFSLICLWFCLALVASSVIPDTSSQGLSTFWVYLNYASKNGKLMLFLAAAVSPLILAKRSGNGSVIDYIRKNIAHAPMVSIKLIVLASLAIIGFAIFIFSYSTLKTRIPVIMPFSWDYEFMMLDQIFFFGNNPWELFKWIYDHPKILYFMDTVYDMWAGILVGTWALCFVSYGYSARVRFQFPLALMLTWFIGGNILATLLSSAGPCYYFVATGLSDPYAQQLEILALFDAESPLRAIGYQSLLWDTYESPGLGLGGISAMPSMHCATTALLVLFAWKKPILRTLALIFFGFIFISSFILAWHYAVDGIFAILIALFGWNIAGRILDWLSKQGA